MLPLPAAYCVSLAEAITDVDAELYIYISIKVERNAPLPEYAN